MFRTIAVTSLCGSEMALTLAFSTATFAQAMATDNPIVAVPQKSVAQTTVKHLMIARGDVRIAHNGTLLRRRTVVGEAVR